MKGLSTLIMFQALISTVSSIFISKMSWTGRIGISFFYKDYQILKVWWKTALLLFGVQIVLILLLWVLKKILGNSKFAFLPGFLIFCVGILGIYLFYLNFTSTNYRYMRENFHVGFYIFWAGWIISSIYFIFVKLKPKLVVEKTNKRNYDYDENILNNP